MYQTGGIEGATHLRDYDFRPVVKICGREAQDGEARIDELVLATIISDQALTMVSTVEFACRRSGT